MKNINWPQLSLSERMKLMEPPAGPAIPVVIDSDTFNEIDDQIAIAWAMLHPQKIDLQALYAAPFTNSFFGKENTHVYVKDAQQGMLLSFDEMHRVIKKVPHKNTPDIFKGSTQYLKNREKPETSPATVDLIERALRCEGTLQVLSIAAPTNVANALCLEPEIIHKIHVTWLGGNSFNWKDNQEFNLMQDVAASRVLFDSGVALTQIPCFGVANTLASSVPELQYYFANTSTIGKYIADIAPNCPWIGFASRKVIWDIATVGYILDPDWFTAEFHASPLINDNFSWSFDNRRHPVRVIQFIERDELFRDLFRKIIDADNQ
ncbi:nucleoside hydrolase [Rahnella variigena]|uniref:nucleoside hydrolase n=1 Tax=Rahnella variigena TaxID=574964 RepID=UPI002447E67C|nr:nucleoside hydrolase [Rahnella variigena]MDH2895150.1 nucleoside hydrolase [Rahnella variigena]